MNARNSGRSGGASGKGWIEVETEVPEEDLLQKGRRLSTPSRAPPRRPAGPLLGDCAASSSARSCESMTLSQDVLQHGCHYTLPALERSRHNPSRDEQVPLLRRRARAEGAGDVHPAGLAVRPRQRRDELRACTAAGSGRRSRLALGGRQDRARDGSTSAAGRATCVFSRRRPGAREPASSERTSRCRCSPWRAGARLAERKSSAFVAGRRASPPLSATAAFDAITVGYGLRNVADPQAGTRRDAARARAGRPGGRPRFRKAGQPGRRARSTSAYLHTMMPAVGWLFHGDPETYLYIPASLERYPGAARRRGADAGRRIRERPLREPSARHDGNQCRRSPTS